MITNALINMAVYLVGLVISWLPSSAGFPSAAHTAFAYFGSYVGMLDPLVPVATIFVCVGIVFGVEILIFGFRGVKWLISHIPFIGGK